MTLLADDLLLVLLDPVTGRPRIDGTKLDYALAGALLLELALAEQVDVTGPKPAKAQVLLVGAPAPGDEVLADAVRRIGEKPRRADALVPLLAKGLRGRLLQGAEQRGDLRHERLRLRPDRWPAVDEGRRRALVAVLHDVLVVGIAPDRRSAALVALLAAVDAAPAPLDLPDRVARKAAGRRASEIGDGDWAAEGVRRAVRAAQAAVAAATTAAVTASMVASSTS